MPEFNPCLTIADLVTMNADDMVAGYRAGHAGEPEPVASVFSRSFLHGWKNGAVDAGHREKDGAQAVLAHAYHAATTDGIFGSGPRAH